MNIRTEIEQEIWRMFLLSENLVNDGFGDLTDDELQQLMKIKNQILDLYGKVSGRG